MKGGTRIRRGASAPSRPSTLTSDPIGCSSPAPPSPSSDEEVPLSVVSLLSLVAVSVDASVDASVDDEDGCGGSSSAPQPPSASAAASARHLLYRVGAPRLEHDDLGGGL